MTQDPIKIDKNNNFITIWNLTDDMKFNAKKLYIIMEILNKKLNISKDIDMQIFHIAQIIVTMFNQIKYTSIDTLNDDKEFTAHELILAIIKKLKPISEIAFFSVKLGAISGEDSINILTSINKMFQHIIQSFGKKYLNIGQSANLMAVTRMLHKFFI